LKILLLLLIFYSCSSHKLVRAVEYSADDPWFLVLDEKNYDLMVLFTTNITGVKAGDLNNKVYSKLDFDISDKWTKNISYREFDLKCNVTIIPEIKSGKDVKQAMVTLSCIHKGLKIRFDPVSCTYSENKTDRDALERDVGIAPTRNHSFKSGDKTLRLYYGCYYKY
jgi:hypothetical protein